MTFYFYDLETSGINPRTQRIMQFAGQRTDEKLNPIGEPQNWLVKLTDEVLPDPEAVLLTGITPQKTYEEGYSEAEFIELFYKEVLQPDTVITGFNNVRFDDEFMRATLWRNFYDPYEWQWKDGRSRWDLLDTVRMVRALRPDGIEWPTDEKGQPTNRLELLTNLNKLDHRNAHDALSDVYATIEVAKLLKSKQEKMFNYLLDVRDKKKVATLADLESPLPFLYTSGRYSNKWQKTTAVVPIGSAPHGAVLVYDLRQDPRELAKLSDQELQNSAFSRNQQTEALPVKVLKMNTCPAVAPLGVLDEASQLRLELSIQTITENLHRLFGIAGFTERLSQLYDRVDADRQAKYTTEVDPDLQIYDGFVSGGDVSKMNVVRSAGENGLADLNLDFTDTRLEALLPRYKIRNFPRSATAAEREAWEKYRTARLIKGMRGQLSLPDFAHRLDELATQRTTENDQFLLKELQLYGESIAPID